MPVRTVPVRSLGAVAIVALLAWSTSVAVVSAAEPLTLTEALAVALSNNPDFLAARQDVGVAEGRETKSRYLNQFNPEIGGQGAHRGFVGGGGSSEYAVFGSQQLEIAGQRGKRIEEAERNTERVAAAIRDKERLLTGQVTRAFFTILVARRRLDLQRTVEGINARTLDATKERVDAGESPRMDANVASIRYGQARHETIAAEAALATANLELKRLLGLPPERAVDPAGELRGLPGAPSEPEAISRALSQRPDLLAAQAELARIRAEADLVRRNRIPNPTLEGFYETEAERNGGRDSIVGGGIRIPIPVFDRQQAELTTLTAEEQRARHQLDATRRSIEIEVVGAVRDYTAAARALGVLESSVLDQVKENFGFIETAYTEGKIDLLDFVVVQNELVQAEMTYLDSLAEFRRAEANLTTAIGTPPTDTESR